MVDLVLDDSCLQPLRLDDQLLAGDVPGAHTNLCGTFDLDMHARQAEAALLERLELLCGPLDHGVDQRCQRIIAVGAVDKHPVQHTKLGRREADAKRVVHQLPHLLDLVCQRPVEAIDRQRYGPQHGVSELAHTAQGRVTTSSGLRVELGYRRGALLGLDL